ncbi:Putative raf-like Ras-binding, TUG ubiquitin-like domain, Ubiquitin-like domain superfamily [Septoria linicola]|uniref:Raf-like Ras-binding, TUG ubiquitin-like domain, Ubiquitin-like domain superfamily n=1 Tax=Septoria linicola TaxID=215465 RepID=A0A9Q9EPA5_9PEZI|nr:Putative raf-like Ras-binding, TUG ubiquitin-like domain, Ubiquitin-like domain superfamily [Septoria linicola]
MASVFVVDTTLQRTQVKVTPGTYLREVLEEACRKKKLNPESWVLKSQDGKKTLDLSQPFRLSGLASGAKLQLVQGSRSASVVNVALQLPESEGGKRLQDKFPSTTSLWLVLRKFEDAVAGGAQKINITQRATPLNVGSGSGRLEYEQPCLNVMGRSLETFADLQKTLGQIGVSGSTLIRLTYKSSGKPLEEAMNEIGQYFNDAESAPSATKRADGAHAGPLNGNTSIPDATTEVADVPLGGDAGQDPAEPSDLPMEDAPIAQPVENDVIASSSVTEQPMSEEPPAKAAKIETDEPIASPTNIVNGIAVYLPSSSTTPAAALQPDDPSSFEPSIEQAKALQSSLQRHGQNKRLLSDKELEEQEAAKQAELSRIQTVIVRVKYPDQSIIETPVRHTETASDLYVKVQDTLAQAPEPFELRYYGAKKQMTTIPNNSDKKLVKDFGFRGKVLVTLVWGTEASQKARQGPSLKEEYRSKAQELKVELAEVQKQGQQDHKAAMKQPEKKDPGSGNKGNIEDKMKKFLGFGKKK